MPDKATLEEYLVQVRRIPEHREAEAEKKIRKMFKELSEDLNAFLGNEYAKYAEEDKLTHAILHQKGEYTRFLEEVLNRVDGIAPEVHEEIQGLIENVYKASYTGMVEAVEATKTVEGLHKYFEPIKAITPETVKRAVKNPIPKLTLTKTLERNRKKIIAAIRREVTTGLTHGDRMSTMAGRIQKYIEGYYKKSILIARTEVHRVREAGFNDSANRIDNILKEHSEYRMTKTWKTMQDGAVRRPTKHNKADHTIMEGQTVLQDEQFTLSDGHKTDAPGQSGVAAQDCNCRCYASRDLMSDAEFFAATGRHFNSKTVDKSGKNDIINTRGGKIMNINNIDSPIEQRNTGKGNPSGIVHADRPLNNRQQKLLEQLPEYDSKITVRKNEVNMKDLAALTAHTGDEFALFTKGHERLIMRGDSRSVNVDLETAKELNRQGYRWSGHTHPGILTDFATPSQGDRDILECFSQKTSVIYNSLGKYRTFEKE